MAVKYAIQMVMLGVCSVEDWKKKEVSLWKIILYGALNLGYGIWELSAAEESAVVWLWHAAVGGIPGAVLLVTGMATGESIGYADGILTMILGISMGLKQMAGILVSAFFGIFLLAAFFFVSSRKNKKRGLHLSLFYCWEWQEICYG